VDTDQFTQELGPEAKRRHSAEVQAGAPRDRSPLSPRRLDQLRGNSGLADPSLSGKSGDAAVAAPGLTPDLDQGLELGDPARERVTVTQWHRIIARLEPGHRPVRSGRGRAAEVARQGPRRLGRADPELGAKTRAKLVVGRQRARPVTGGGEHPHQLSCRLLGERIDRQPTPSPADRRDAILTAVGLGRQLRKHGAQVALVRLARLEHPLVVKVAEQPAATEIASAGPIAGGEPPPELVEIGSRRRREPDPLPRRLKLEGRRTKRRAQSPQRAAQAGARTRVEHLGPQPPGKLSAGMMTAMNCQPREEAAWLSRRQSDPLALDLDLQRSKQANQHRGKSNPARARRRNLTAVDGRVDERSTDAGKDRRDNSAAPPRRPRKYAKHS
jgi:hypothetical protein